jgi:sugar transferase (PEP-CTERM/EpsH1 system associated)
MDVRRYDRLKILWVKAGGLVPPDSGGKIRSYNILRELARHHEITLFSFHQELEDDQHPALRGMLQDVVCVPLRLPGTRGLREMAVYARYLLSGQSYMLMKYCRPEVRRRLDAVVARGEFDVILCDFIVPAPIIPWNARAAKVIFTHNVEAQIWKRHYQVTKNPLWKAISWREWKTMERAERKYLRAADHVLAVSDTDRDAFASFVDPQRLSVVQTGVDVDYFRPERRDERPSSLVFTGSMDWLPNEDGILYFAEQILPLVREQIPDVTLTVVGRRPSAKLRELAARQPGISLTGWVEDVRPYLAQGAVFIVPLRIGGGTRLKIFEAMAAGLPVISTTVGAEGLPVHDGENIVIADAPTAFAERTVELLRDMERRARLGREARRLVVEKYSWRTVALELSQTLERVVREVRRTDALDDRGRMPHQQMPR